MALSESLPYGIRDIKLTPVSVSGVVGTSVDLPNARTLSFEEAEEYEELRGDDKVVATRGNGPSVSWELESGGISLEALVVLNGGTCTVTGVTPNQIKKYVKKAADARPEFKAEGQAISEGGGDLHTVIWRAKATDGVSGEFSDGGFFLTSASGTALPSKTTGSLDTLYEFVQNETAVPIS
jgi:hypothetical protein